MIRYERTGCRFKDILPAFEKRRDFENHIRTLVSPHTGRDRAGAGRQFLQSTFQSTLPIQAETAQL